ncbi:MULTISPECIES: MFS transporter [unclassified Gilliamella]|uniref:MFS transporter n=1 Tax=unclassified Gilliamella TaxID=2685620 RepID=UPI00226AD9B7|nr:MULTISPECIES: MFS transporter [unclassified Gilliamella]MCX8600523.1 MFS transporter [Gilliamella sp. B3722]MCX8608765.1 MFS transporter [Gilliamella sp. B3771]MCX8609739.1 MFS transporter [Gilliamella sp. B3891]MCX8612171.1 MFS transporter [Gilliamella sp. B3773]MCX8616565.1 MFS transporter [Gilliamella sp. B3770]
MNSTHSQGLSFWLVFLMAFAIGVTIASNYYAQPLLHSITHDLHIAVEHAGSIIMTAQLSYAVGLLFITPLGDMIERKRLILILMLLSTCGLVISASSQNLWMLIVGTAMTGLFSTVAQVLIPFAATLAKPEHRGKIVGTLMSGMLLGILLGRTFAGAISTIADWHYVYWIATGIMLIVTFLLWLSLPRYCNHISINYLQLLLSIGALYRQEPVLKIRSLLAITSFALFSLLWTPLAFLLTDAPYHYSDFIIGLFGLAGAAGALGSPIVGKLSDKGKGKTATTIGLALLLASWLPLSLAQYSIIALILGVILLDFAVQVTHVSNMSAIYQIRPEARSRINTGYMVSYFTGGMLGSVGSTYLFSHYGWIAIVIAGTILGILGLIIWYFYTKTYTISETS